MKNTLLDLNNHLFEALERLNDEDMTQEQLEQEIKKDNAIASISNQIIANAKLELEAVKLCYDYGNIDDMKKLPMMLQYDKKIN